MWRRIALAFAALLLVAQVVPITRENPPHQGEVPAPQEVRAILERSCYDCHSRETRWPWYGYVAPVSWLLARDIQEAREHLDFTAWDTYSEKKRREHFEEIWEEVEEGEMPLWFYLPLHPEARLSERDLAHLKEWTHGAAPLGAAASASTVDGRDAASPR
jgi:hypothetical protein